MEIADADRHRVAVVRVEVIGETVKSLLIELLEVGRADGGGDRFLGSATDVSGGCGVLHAWLREIAAG